MTTSDIFSQVAKRMIEGLMTHSQLADYFGFLGLEGYQESQICRFFDESNGYKKITRYYLKHYDRLLIEMPFEKPNIIPSDWYQYSRQQVNNTVRQTSIKVGFEKWIDWERSTKQFYEERYKLLLDMKEIAAAAELQKYIVEVDKELADAEQEKLKLEAMNYSIVDIMVDQENVYKKYKKEIKEITLYDKHE